MAPIPAPDGSLAPRAFETRARNERIAASARRHHFDSVTLVPFLCECSDPACETVMRITLDEYGFTRGSADFLVVPGHQVDEARISRVRDAVWLYRLAPSVS